MNGIEETAACSHTAAVTFYTESITDKSCKFTAYPCESEANFNAGNCIKCKSANSCNRMGYYSSPNNDQGSLYLNTQDPLKSPMCLQNYVLTLYSSYMNNLQGARGKFTVSFKTAKETSSVEIIDSGDTVILQNSIEKRLISLKKPIDSTSSIISATVSYTRTPNILINWLFSTKWGFKYLKNMLLLFQSNTVYSKLHATV